MICECTLCKKLVKKRIDKRRRLSFCSRRCWYKFNTKRKITNCLFCSKEFFSVPSDIKREKGVFCSTSCRSKHWWTIPENKQRFRHKIRNYWAKNTSPLKNKKRSEDVVNKIRIAVRNRKYPRWKYPKREAAYLKKRGVPLLYCKGEKSHLWKGGVTKGNRAARLNLEYVIWRREIFKKYNNQCCDCGSRDGLQAHHIKSFSEFPDLRYDLTNGKLLCGICHRREHEKNGDHFSHIVGFNSNRRLHQSAKNE